MAMRASAPQTTTGSLARRSDSTSASKAGSMANMAGMAVGAAMDAPMDMSDIDGKEIVSASGEKLAVFNRFTGWPELKEAMMSGKIKAAYLLAPMAMDLADRGVPVKIVALGHRSGAVIMVGTKTTARNLGDLRGKRIAIPSRFAVDNIFVHRLMKKYGMTDADVTLVEMAPADMPAALYAGAVDAYATGEPFGALAQRKGYARVLHMTRDEWPEYICCVLTVRQELIDNDRSTVQRLVDNVLAAGAWLESDTTHRHVAADLAAKREYFNQDSSLIRFVMDNPKDRVTYGDLRLVKAEFDELMQLAVDGKILARPVAYEKYVDESFVRAYRPTDIKLAK
jgi:NitT/TauT family transport system substrate-binding protein